MTIRRLPEALVNRIAAGEVVERPAAAVKELVENAIDAGAARIDVALRDGGSSFILVADDGIGMSVEELALAIERHATSKLPEDDLVHIRALGFRGEALPAIGAVARLTIASRRRGSNSSRRRAPSWVTSSTWSNGWPWPTLASLLLSPRTNACGSGFPRRPARAMRRG